MLSRSWLKRVLYFTCASSLSISLPALAATSLPIPTPIPASAMVNSPQAASTSTAALAAEMDAYVQAHHDVMQFMGTALVVRGGETVFSQGYGMASLEHQLPNTPQTRFRLGSVTKQFTAAAILQLQDRGLVDVQAPVSTYLPDYPNKTITLHHLLTHTAGIPNLTSFPDYFEWMKLPTTLDDLIVRFKDLPLEFEPGSQYRYSNSGYVLLTQVIETVSGQSYDNYVTENLLVPLGMKATGYEQPLAIVPGLASGYQIAAGNYQQAAHIDMSVPQGAGGLYSTAADLVRWNQFLFGKGSENAAVLSDRTRAAMTSPQVSLGIEAAPNLFYGYGLMIDSQFEQPLVGHGGGINGFVTSLVYVPEQEATIVVLSNVESINPNQMTSDLVAMLLGNSYELPQALDTATVDAAVLDRYVGTYQLTPDFQITLTVKDGQLYGQGTGQPAIALYPASETEFFARVPELRIVFSPAADGTVDSLSLIQGGQTSTAPRAD